MAKIQSVVKGDIIIERAGRKNRMIPVRTVAYNACSTPSVHINNDSCYEWGADVRLVDGEGTLGDMEKELTGLGDLEEDFPNDADLRLAGVQSIEAWADRMPGRLPQGLGEEELRALAEAIVQH